jgi:hypothetical protein
LLLLLDLLDHFDIDLQDIGDSISRSQSQPLCQGDISDAVALVELDPNKFLCLGGVLDIMSFN